MTDAEVERIADGLNPKAANVLRFLEGRREEIDGCLTSAEIGESCGAQYRDQMHYPLVRLECFGLAQRMGVRRVGGACTWGITPLGRRVAKALEREGRE